MIEPAFLAVALACRINQTEAARLADAVDTLSCALQKTRFECDGYGFREADADETSRRDRIA